MFEQRSRLRRRLGAAAFAVAIGLVPLGSAKADSEMHQSPELFRGSADACSALAAGRVQNGGFSWRLGCGTITPAVPRRHGTR